jgi:excinuclease ABC subunit C
MAVTAVPQPASFDAKGFLKSLTSHPGVYRMVNSQGKVLYVGKARNLKKRLASYFRRSGLPVKTQAMMAQVHHIEVTVTLTEGEALILENNLIKDFKPRYNVLLRDDKSYPYIYLSPHQDFPRFGFYRGARQEQGRYFGPYPSASAVRESLQLLQKVFPVRQCEDSFYRNRSRPCLQYQIKRCTAPCVGLVDKDAYQQDVRHAVLFLEGKNAQVIDELIARMETAATQLHFEEAARYRDQIATLRHVQEKQYVSGERGDLDVIACAARHGIACVEVFYVRAGRVLGNKTFYPQHAQDAEAADVLAAFLPQYYLGREVPGEILVNHTLEDRGLLESALAAQTQHRVTITHKVRGERSRWLSLAAANAEHAITRQLANKANTLQRFEALQEALSLADRPQRIECFDISHTLGEATVASCVVFETEGPLKSDYRRFNIDGITPGDDYAALHQALLRRYTRLKQGEGKLPDLLFIDGGKGQVAAAAKVLEELQIGDLAIIGIAKGPERKAGAETLFLSGSKRPFILPTDSPALHLIQQIRDEAHRFAITGHRQRRGKTRSTSPLERIPGLGPKRRRMLLSRLGGLQEVARAGVEELAKVHGISRALAQRIYDVFHDDGR